MTVKFNIDLKSVKQCFALMSMDIPTDEEIKEKMEDKVIDLSNNTNEDMREAKIGFTLIAIGELYKDEK